MEALNHVDILNERRKVNLKPPEQFKLASRHYRNAFHTFQNDVFKKIEMSCKLEIKLAPVPL